MVTWDSILPLPRDEKIQLCREVYRALYPYYENFRGETFGVDEATNRLYVYYDPQRRRHYSTSVVICSVYGIHEPRPLQEKLNFRLVRGPDECIFVIYYEYHNGKTSLVAKVCRD